MAAPTLIAQPTDDAQPAQPGRPAQADAPAPGAAFVDRHIGASGHERATMLAALGLPSLEALVDAAVPAGIRQRDPLDLPAARTEVEVLADLRALAALNAPRVQMIGQGYSATTTPAVIARNVLESPAWYTAYTPYQPEVSQGRLEALLNFQTAVEDLTALPVANASLLDEASAVAEAALLMRRARKGSTGAVVLDADLHPQSIAVTTGRLEAVGIEVVVADLGRDGLPAGDLTGVVLQQPGTSGRLHDHSGVIAEAKERAAMVTIAADLLALTLVVPPGEQGADIAVGSAQRFGVPLWFGGPHAAYMAVRTGLERNLPGRLVGVSRDTAGTPALRLALQTREQHIRRDRATSNICTAQALLAIVAGAYAVHHGPEGLRAIAARACACATALAAVLTDHGTPPAHAAHFDTLTVPVPGRARAVVDAAERAGVNLRLVDADTVGVACDETTAREHLTVVAQAFGVERAGEAVEAALAAVQGASSVSSVPAALRRTTGYLAHPTFHRYRSETQMLRYLRRLADRDLALDRTMIPLGSCTMKLNATTEMQALSWPELASIHPFAPEHQTAGWRALIEDLEHRLAVITGYDRVSVQPNAGSQGELAGLLAIRDYHRSRGQGRRTVCLVPASAHGTNAASAVLAGMRVVVVATGADGAIDRDDLAARIAEHADDLAAVMITYPSTHGVYDADVREVADAVHAAGGQVYIDGANLNALVGLAKPGAFGGDVSHLNLHKTFCIPHGGGGPGVGPVAVAAHLAPFLPGDPRRRTGGDGADADGSGVDGPGGVPVTGSRYGSAGVLPVSWAYIALMGGEGLTAATSHALLAANYVAARLHASYPVLYTGAGGLVAHECVLDLRGITARTGVTAEDVAKRLVDHGFHAPTLSFPVAGTLMVEPTESEDLDEIDRFVDAMIAIRAEIEQVATGEVPLEASALRRAPHTASDVTATEWDRPYTREQAAFPSPGMRQDKYFPPVGRIDGAHGDRNLVCACPPVDAYAEAPR